MKIGGKNIHKDVIALVVVIITAIVCSIIIL